MNNSYNLNVDIDIENEIIKVICKVDYFTKYKIDNLRFYISSKMDVKVSECSYEFDYEINEDTEKQCPFIKDPKILKVNFKEFIEEQEQIELILICEGKFDITDGVGCNTLNTEWIELGLYCIWHPLLVDLNTSNFKADIKISEGYKVVNAIENGLYQTLEQNQSTFDCTIIASNKFECISTSNEGINVNVYYTNEDKKDIAKNIIKYLNSGLNIFSRFGKTSTKNLSIVIGERDDGGGYCRPELISLSSLEGYNELDNFHFICHELAHMWWLDAPSNSYEDWLNESFAEYSALIAIREEFGEVEFTKLINGYRERSKDLKPIMNIKRDDPTAYGVLYEKGACVLNKLEIRIGKNEFIELLKEMKLRKISSTESFLELVEDMYGKDVKQYIYYLLCS